MSIWSSFSHGMSTFSRKNRWSIFQSYFQAPIGITLLLLLCWGVESVMKLLPFQFPAPVIAMLFLFALIMILHVISPKIFAADVDREEGIAPKLVQYGILLPLGPGMNLLLKYMPLFFTPAFILVPARDSIPPREIGLIIGCFIPTSIMAWLFTVYLCKGVAIASQRLVGPSSNDSESQMNRGTDDEALSNSDNQTKQRKAQGTKAPLDRFDTLRDDSEPEDQVIRKSTQGSTFLENETGIINDPDRKNSLGSNSSETSLDGEITRVPSRIDPQYDEDLELGEKRDPKQHSFVRQANSDSESDVQDDRFVTFLEFWFDFLVYLIVMIPIGLPLFYLLPPPLATLPFFGGLNVLSFLFGVRILPESWRRYLHPILVSSIITVLGVWAAGATKGWDLKKTLGYFSTSAEYLQLFSPSPWDDLSGPGAGDIMSSLLDAGIVALALQLYQHRHTLRSVCVQMILVVLPNVAISLLLWPLIAGDKGMGLTPSRAVIFAGRFMSTPLAIEFVNTVKGDEGIAVILVVVTGIIIVLVKDPVFRFLRVGKDDNLTIGLTTGILGGAIGTSSLLKTNPIAMAIATVGFASYGLFMLIAVAISPVATFVATIAGL